MKKKKNRLLNVDTTQLRQLAELAARQAGLDDDTADAVAARVVEAAQENPHRTDLNRVLIEQIQKHAQP